MNADLPQSDPDALWKRPEDGGFDPYLGGADPPAAIVGEPLIGPRSSDPPPDDQTTTWPPRDPDTPFTIAIVSVQGVKFDEWSAFRSVLELWPGSRTINVGSVVGRVGGAGGSVVVQAVYEDVPAADVVVVPGGLGVEEASRDPRLRHWLRRTVPSSRWVLSSSTGSVVLAAAGLLGGKPAATFWLAADLLARHGSEKVSERVHVSDDDRVVTCAGSASAFDCACLVIERELGPDEVAQIRAQLVPPVDDRRNVGSRRRRHQALKSR